MPPERLLEMLRARPFVPFRITMTDGRQFDVSHPDTAMAGRAFVIVGIPAADDPLGFVGRTVTLAMLHVTSLEPLEVAAP